LKGKSVQERENLKGKAGLRDRSDEILWLRHRHFINNMRHVHLDDQRWFRE